MFIEGKIVPGVDYVSKIRSKILEKISIAYNKQGPSASFT